MLYKKIYPLKQWTNTKHVNLYYTWTEQAPNQNAIK